MWHVVQVRAQEEFGHGAWSEWSREAVGTPWTGNSGRVGMCPPPSCGAVWGSVCHTAPHPPPLPTSPCRAPGCHGDGALQLAGRGWCHRVSVWGCPIATLPPPQKSPLCPFCCPCSSLLRMIPTAMGPRCRPSSLVMTLLMMPGVRMELGAPWGAGTPPNPITDPHPPPLCCRSCTGGRRPLPHVPLCPPGGGGQSAAGHHPLLRHRDEVSAGGVGGWHTPSRSD